MSLAYAALAVNILLLVGGQILWKVGLTRAAVGHATLGRAAAGQAALGQSALAQAAVSQAAAGHGVSWLQVALSPFIWGGLALYGVATVLWLFALSRLPLSVAYPIQALAYVLGMIAAERFLGEKVPLWGWLGGLLIFLGVALIAYRPGT